MVKRGEVLGIFYLNIIRLLKVKKGDIELKRVLAEAGLSKRDYLPSIRYPYDEYNQLLGGASTALKMDRESLEIYIGQLSYYGLAKLYPKAFSEKDTTSLVKAMIELFNVIHPNTEEPFLETHMDDNARTVLRYNGLAPICNLLKGFILTMWESHGVRAAIHETECTRKTHCYCDMVIGTMGGK